MISRHRERVSRIARGISAGFEYLPPKHTLEVSCFYDGDAAEMCYMDDFKVLHRERRGDADVLIYGYEGNFKPDSDKLFEIADYDKFGQCYGIDYDYRHEIDFMYSSDLADAVLGVMSIEDVSNALGLDLETEDDVSDALYGMEWGEIKSALPKAYDAVVEKAKSFVCLPDLEEIFDKDPVEEGGLKYKPGWTEIHVNGYSGESYTVVCTENAAEYKSAIGHELVDCPICCRVYLDGAEYYVDFEDDFDKYEWDRDKALEIARRLLGDKLDDDLDDLLQDAMPAEPSAAQA